MVTTIETSELILPQTVLRGDILMIKESGIRGKKGKVQLSRSDLEWV